MPDYIKTVDQFYRACRKGKTPWFLNEKDLEVLGLTRADDPLEITETASFHTSYSQKVFSWLHYEDTMYRLLPKIVMEKTGFYAITTLRTNRAAGIAELGALGDTDHPKPEKGTITPKLVDATTEASELALIRDGMGETMGSVWEINKADMEEDMRDRIDAALLGDPDTLAALNPESGLRVSTTKAGEAALFTAGDCDMYGFDRSSATTYDCGHFRYGTVPKTDDTLTAAMIEDAIQDIKAASGARPQFMVTGFDTSRRIKSLVDDYYRFDKVNVSFTINGVEVTGQDTQFHIAAWDGIPIFENANMQKDTISRILMLNTQPKGSAGPRLAIQVARPLLYIETSDAVLLDAHKKKGDMSMWLELVAGEFKSQGCVSELK